MVLFLPVVEQFGLAIDTSHRILSTQSRPLLDPLRVNCFFEKQSGGFHKYDINGRYSLGFEYEGRIEEYRGVVKGLVVSIKLFVRALS